ELYHNRLLDNAPMKIRLEASGVLGGKTPLQRPSKKGGNPRGRSADKNTNANDSERVHFKVTIGGGGGDGRPGAARTKGRSSSGDRSSAIPHRGGSGGMGRRGGRGGFRKGDEGGGGGR